MLRPLCALLALQLLSACATDRLSTMQQSLTLAAQERLSSTLAGHFIRELGKAGGAVITELSTPGGYLDNPLVRILLPPPLGLAIDVGRDLTKDPQATLLVTLMNRAAESAIPVAGPILKTALSQVTPAEARALLDGKAGSATEFLKAKTGAALHSALQPVIAAQLAASGAQQVYADVTKTYHTLQPATPTSTEPPPDLVGYVTDQAVQGAFKSLGKREAAIHESLESVTAGMQEGMSQSPAANIPAP